MAKVFRRKVRVVLRLAAVAAMLDDETLRELHLWTRDRHGRRQLVEWLRHIAALPLHIREQAATRFGVARLRLHPADHLRDPRD